MCITVNYVHINSVYIINNFMLLMQVSHWSNYVHITLLCFDEWLTSVKRTQSVIITAQHIMKDSQSMQWSDFV